MKLTFSCWLLAEMELTSCGKRNEEG